MLEIRTLAITSLFALVCLLLSGPALASTRCQCNNGAIVESMDDGDGACDDACDDMGGGSAWQPDDSDDGDDEGTAGNDRQDRREQRRGR